MAAKTRQELKRYFVKNAIPTESNFADLIDAQLNQLDDGLVKPPNQALGVVGNGAEKQVLRFYSAAGSANPDWLFSLSPRAISGAGNVAGFGVVDGAGATRLLLDPSGQLAVAGGLTVGGNATIQGSLDAVRLLKVSAPVVDVFSGLEFRRIDEAGRTHLWNLWHMNAGQAGRPNSLELWEYKTDSSGVACNGNTADGAMCDPRLIITEGGNVGIGTAPGVKLDVAGSTRITGDLEVTGGTKLGDLGVSKPIADFNAPLRSGFYEGHQVTAANGEIPDQQTPWTHLVTLRHSNPHNNYQLQIASNYDQNDKLYFRKIAVNSLDRGSSPWNEVATLAAGIITAPKGARLNNISVGCEPPQFGAIPFPYETVQLQGAHNLRICFGTNERLTLSNAGSLQVSGNAGVLNLVGSDHAYVQFYPQGVQHRKGWIGFGSAGTQDLSIAAEAGKLTLSGSEVALTGGTVSVNNLLRVDGWLQSAGGAILNGIAIGRDPTPSPGGDVNFPYAYETVGVTDPRFALRLQGGAGIVLSVGNGGQAVLIDGSGRMGVAGQLPNDVPQNWGGGITTWDLVARGSITANNDIFGKAHKTPGQDLAEDFMSRQPLEAGEVVSLTDTEGYVQPSKATYDPLVAGIVSTDPGVSLNTRLEDAVASYPIALSGRVPCKVTNEGGPIAVGDLLTSSSTPGHAMKARTDGPGAPAGTVIGKAMQSFDGERGVITVFVFLR